MTVVVEDFNLFFHWRFNGGTFLVPVKYNVVNCILALRKMNELLFYCY